LWKRNQAALNAFLEAMLSGDVQRVAALLAQSVQSYSDGGGRYHAAMEILIGPERVARFLLGVSAKRPAPLGVRQLGVNGLPGLLITYDESKNPRFAQQVLFRLDVNEREEINRIHMVVSWGAYPTVSVMKTDVGFGEERSWAR
jgi:hypothetical protein